MASVRTAISVPEGVLAAVDRLARKRHQSRSSVFADAALEYIRRRQNEQMLEALDATYADGPTPQEQAVLDDAREHARTRIVGEW
jgi:metal-responsive CopG/Arc/MetJ family transcriptional regulator